MKNRATVLAWFFWLIVWQVCSILIDNKIFLPAPTLVFFRLIELVRTPVFYKSIAFTLISIAQGFVSGLILATILASLSYKNKFFEIILKPVILIFKSVPVASFIILVLIWFSSKKLSIIISFMMVLPVIYTNILQGLKNTDEKIIEMTKIYKISMFKKIRYIYIFSVLPHLKSALVLSIGLSFKAGIAGEVIGLPSNSIGEQIFNSKIYLDTVTLFSWTIIVLILSLVFEKIITFSLEKITRKLEGVC